MPTATESPVRPATTVSLPAPAAPPAQQKWLFPLIVLIVGTFMAVLDSSIVNVAVPKIQAELSAAPKDVEWIVTGFTLALGVAVPPCGWLGSRLGEARLYTLALLGFAIASALCGSAWDLGSMIAFRVLQAFPGGVLPVVSMTLVYRTVPPAKLGIAMGVYGLGVSVAPGIGPVLGGWFVDYVDWRLIFFINVPICLIAMVGAMLAFPKDRPSTWSRFDILGFVTSASGLFALLLAASKGQDWGWDGYRIRMLLVFGLLSLALFVVVELEVDHPMINLRIFRSWQYTSATLHMCIVLATLTIMLYFVPQFLQVVQGMEALDAGLVLAPSAGALILINPLTQFLYLRYGSGVPLAIGFAVMAYGSSLMSTMNPDTPRFDVTLWTSIINLGAGMIFMPIFSTAPSTLAPELTASSSAMLNVAQRTAASIAVAAAGSMSLSASAQLMADRGALLATGHNALPQVSAALARGPEAMLGYYQAFSLNALTQTYNNAYYAASLLCVVGVLIALTLGIRPPDPNAAVVHGEM
jgi:EmrB/QacA subfamily drug resistance transporter